MERNIVLDTLLEISDGDSLDYLISELNNIKENNKHEYEKIYIDFDYSEDYCDIAIKGTRLETNAEYVKRLEGNKYIEKQRIESDKIKFLALLEKYPNLRNEIINGK